MAIPRRTIEELYTKYDFHPDLFDLYVEGQFDRDFINFITDLLNLGQQISIYDITDIDIPPGEVLKFNLTTGSNKSRVIALSRLFDIKYGNRITNIACIVDADTDRVLNKLQTSHHLLYTDNTCMEMYAATIKQIERFIKFTANLDQNAATEFIALCEKILPSQFALRATNEVLGLNSAVPSYESGLTKKKDIHSFDPQKYCAQYVIQSGLNAQKDAIETKFNALMGVLPNDVRDKAHGHDFIYLLFSYLWEKGSLKLQDKQNSALEFGNRLLAFASNCSEVKQEPLFARIVSSAVGATTMRP